jgi:hypothetical protein
MLVRCHVHSLSHAHTRSLLTLTSQRGRSCEFEDGCEWREMKAKQLYEETQARKRLRAEMRSTDA